MTAEPPRDPFPTERFTTLLRHLPRYGVLAWKLARDPRIPASRRAALLGGAAYLVSPIDLVPGIIPVAGQLDDAMAVLIALRLALSGLSSAERTRMLADAGLGPDALDADMRTVGATYAWMGRRGARAAWHGTRALARASGRLGSTLARRYLRPITRDEDEP